MANKRKLLSHPGRLTWNLQITHLERKIIFQISMILFHVSLQEGKFLLPQIMPWKWGGWPSHRFSRWNATGQSWQLSGEHGLLCIWIYLKHIRSKYDITQRTYNISKPICPWYQKCNLICLIIWYNVFICSMINLGQMKQTHWVCFQQQRLTSALLTVFPQELYNMSPKKEPFQKESSLPTSIFQGTS